MINIIGIYILLVILVQRLYCQPKYSSQIDYCSQTKLVKDFYSTENLSTICLGCYEGYVLSYDLSKCISYLSFDEKTQRKIYFCKRFGRSQGRCEEAICGVQINESGKFVSISQGHPDENCAIFDSSTKSCIKPRFGYSLDQNTGEILKDQTKFCALIIDGQCKDYFGTFIGIPEKDSAVLTHLNNPEYLDNVSSTLQNPVCRENYDMVKDPNNQGVYYGCMERGFTIENCSKFDSLSQLCTLCNDSYSLRVDGKECVYNTDNCVRHNNKYTTFECLLCLPNYRLYLGKCISLERCKAYDNILEYADSHYQNCSLCFYPYYGSSCENQVQNTENGCETLDTKGRCTKCVDNETKFFNMQSNVCKDRKLSLNCKVKNPLADWCNSAECIKGYYFNVQPYDNLFYYNYNGQNSQFSCNDFSNQIQSTNVFQSWFWMTNYNWDYLVNGWGWECYWYGWCPYWCWWYGSYCWYYDWWGYYNWWQYGWYWNYYYNNYYFYNNFLFGQFKICNLNDRLFSQDFNSIKFLWDNQDLLRNPNQIFDPNCYMSDNINGRSQEACILRDVNEIEGCSELEKCNNSCQDCKEGYIAHNVSDDYFIHLFKNQCKKNDNPNWLDNCITYNNDRTHCSQCKDGYTNYLDSCQVGTVAHCVTYGDYNQCSQCSKNYALFNNRCFYVELCAYFQFDGVNLVCQSCQKREGLFIALHQKFGQSQDCIISEIPCSYYVNDKCMECYDGYVMVNNESNACIKETKDLYYCRVADVNENCISCVNGYYLFQGKCISLIGWCRNYNYCRWTYSDDKGWWVDCNDQNCVGYNQQCSYECQEDSYQYYSSCNSCNQFSYSEIGLQGLCQGCNAYRCTECLDGFVWSYQQSRCMYQCQDNSLVDSPNNCISCNIENCQFCKSSDKCYKCLEPFFVENGICVQQCSEGYFINPILNSNNQCYTCEEGCQSCQFVNGVTLNCFQCQEEYFNHQGKCVKQCPKFEQNGVCADICNTYVKDDKYCVETCPYFYKLVTGSDNLIQKVCINSCPSQYYKYEDDAKLCTEKCRDTYFQSESNHKCLLCQANNCEICKQDINKCQKCKKGYYAQDGVCYYICPLSKNLVQDQQDCNKCNIQGCQRCKDNNPNECLACKKNFFNQKTLCQCPTNNGYYLAYPYECNKCDIDNCQRCSAENFCFQCDKGYYLLYSQDISTNEESQVCVQQCPDGYFAGNGYCNKCQDHCIFCNSISQCSLCEMGYVASSQSKTYFDYNTWMWQVGRDVKCMFRCPNGQNEVYMKDCKCADAYCSKCDKNPYSCQECKESFIFNSKTNKCEFDLTKSTCPSIPYCLSCNNEDKLCTECVNNLELENGKCLYKCNSGTLVPNPENCSQNLCNVQNCVSCDPSNPNVCLICSNSYKFLVNGNCYSSCPAGYFKNPDFDMCEICDFRCKTCSSKNKCDSCKASQAISSKCLCPKGMILYDSTCVSKCPYFSTRLNDNYCVSQCQDGYYPIFGANGELQSCSKDTSERSEFCQQNIQNLPQIINVSMVQFQKTDKQYILQIFVERTPKTCYEFVLMGANNSIFDFMISNESLQGTTYHAIIPKDRIDNKIDISCTDLWCSTFLNIFYLGYQQYTIQITINFDITIILNNQNLFNGQTKFINVVCTSCSIPQYLVIASSIQTSCQNGSYCDGSQINASTNDQITIIQRVEDPRFKNNQLEPHSLNILFTNQNNVSGNILINNYSYDNSINGQISYSFKAIGLQGGTLVVTSSCSNAKYNRRMLISSSSSNENSSTSNSFYPQMKVKFNYESKEEEEQQPAENDKNLIIIIICVAAGSTLIIVAAIIISCKYCRKKEIKRETPTSQVEILDKKDSPQIMNKGSITLEEQDQEIKLSNIVIQQNISCRAE